MSWLLVCKTLRQIFFDEITILFFIVFYISSRQRYVLGDTAMQKMAKSHVFLSGMGGLGVEIGKQYLFPIIPVLLLNCIR